MPFSLATSFQSGLMDSQFLRTERTNWKAGSLTPLAAALTRAALGAILLFVGVEKGFVLLEVGKAKV